MVLVRFITTKGNPKHMNNETRRDERLYESIYSVIVFGGRRIRNSPRDADEKYKKLSPSFTLCRILRENLENRAMVHTIHAKV